MSPIVRFLYLYLLVPQKSLVIEDDGTEGPQHIRYNELKDAIRNNGLKWSIAGGISTDEVNEFLKKYLVQK
jgi:hypothetical protein